jgi:hypothetical protein
MTMGKEIQAYCREALSREKEHRKHVHDMIFKVMTAYVTLSLAVVTAAIAFLTSGGAPPNWPAAVGILLAGIAAGGYHHLYIINLHVNRDFRREREKLLGKALVYHAYSQNGDANEALSQFFDHSRGQMKMNTPAQWTSLFSLFRYFIASGVSPMIVAVALLLHWGGGWPIELCGVGAMMVIGLYLLLVRVYHCAYLDGYRSRPADRELGADFGAEQFRKLCQAPDPAPAQNAGPEGCVRRKGTSA